jgi:hypothetical protein
MAKSDKMYRKSPKLGRNKDTGDMEVQTPDETGSEEMAPGADAGAPPGMDAGASPEGPPTMDDEMDDMGDRHAQESSDMRKRHRKERKNHKGDNKDDLYSKQANDFDDMNKRQAQEMKKLQKRQAASTD